MEIYKLIKNILTFIELRKKQDEYCPYCGYKPKKHNLLNFHKACFNKFNSLPIKKQNKLAKNALLGICPYCKKKVEISPNKTGTRCGNCGMVY